MARSTSSISGAGRSGRAVPSDGGCSWIRFAVSSIEDVQYGWKPARASQSRTPTAQTSASGPASAP